MTFTATELRILALSDARETGAPKTDRRRRGRPPGRPRTRPSTPDVERRRAYNLARYYAKKSKTQGHDR